MKINISGKAVEGERVDFATLIEGWNEYHLEDGTILRIKTVLTRVIKTTEKNEEGNPIFHWTLTQVHDVQAAPPKEGLN